jgi:hypothetical protein
VSAGAGQGPAHDPYAVLGVPRDASEDQIARARRRLSREYHPDVNPAPDAAARFDEVQQAFQQLSAARPESGRDRDEQGRTRVTRDPGGGYGSAAEVAPGIFLQPAEVDFGRLTPDRPRADAKVTLAWTGPAPVRLECAPGSGWWANVRAEQPAKSCVVFYLRAQASAGTRNGRRRAEFTVIFNDTTLTVSLAVEIRGEFPPASPADSTWRSEPRLEGLMPSVPGEPPAWLRVVTVTVARLARRIIEKRS